MVVNGGELAAVLGGKLKAEKKREDDADYKNGNLQAHLQQSQCEQDKVAECITCEQGAICLFSTGMWVEREYRDCRVDERGRMMLDNLAARMAAQVVEVQQTKFETTKATTGQHTAGLGQFS